jgi:GT2 family glycosyltransferase
MNAIVKKLFTNKVNKKNRANNIPIKESENFNNVGTYSVKDKISAHYDHAIPLSADVICILGWERIGNREDLDFKIFNDENALKTKELDVIYYSRPDVNTHFNDDKNFQWGVLRIIRLEAGQSYNQSGLMVHLGLKEKSKQFSIDSFNNPDAIFHALNSFNPIEKILATDYLCQPYNKELLSIQEIGFVGIEKLPGFIRMHWEIALLLPSYGVFVQGWLVDAESTLKGVYLKQGTYLSDNLLMSSTRLIRPDVNESFNSNVSNIYKAGLYGVFNLKGIDASQPVSIVLQTHDGQAAISELPVANKGEDSVSIIQSMLAPYDVNKVDYDLELNGYLGKAIGHVWKTKGNMSGIPNISEYGSQPQKPVCSLIIPIYGRYDFVKYQITQFVKDEYMSSAEIIYVLDDPRLLSEFNRFCASVYAIFKMPFKTVSYSKNLGFAGANNMGVSQAKSEYVLLLNSDVMPKYSGWLEQMIDTYTELDTPGILGARLLFEDNTIQHDGLMYQKIKQYGPLWLIEHPAKGLPDWMAPSEGVREIPSVTGACMLMRTSLYQELNGLDESYVLGDFEDSDLCLKALQAGYKNYINSDISLYHLERQSQNLFEDKSWKHKLTIYNGLQHTKRWNKLIEIMDRK